VAYFIPHFPGQNVEFNRESTRMDSNKKDRGTQKSRGLFSREKILNSKFETSEDLPLLQKGSASVSLAVSRILRDTSSVVAALSKRRAQDEILTSHYNLSTKILDLMPFVSVRVLPLCAEYL